MGFRLTLTGVLLVLLTAGCATRPGPPAEEPVSEPGGAVEMEQLHDWLTGFFEAKPPASRRGQPSRYMLAAPILDEADAGRWVYVVQWKAGSAEPERQLVYHLQSRTRRGIAVDIYSLLHPIDNPINPSPESLAAIRTGWLERREGCRIRLSQDGLSYVGGTRGRDCPSTYRGAERLRIELTVREDEVREWLQGYNASGQRLWSADEGGRIYRRTDG